jgi:hypothetical protein
MLYMYGFHGEVVKDLKCIEVSSKYTPFFFGLIVGTEIRYVISLVVPVGCFLSLAVPFDRAIAVTSDIICLGDRFPLDSSARVSSHSGSIANSLNFALIEIVDLSFSI